MNVEEWNIHQLKEEGSWGEKMLRVYGLFVKFNNIPKTMIHARKHEKIMSKQNTHLGQQNKRKSWTKENVKVVSNETQNSWKLAGWK